MPGKLIVRRDPAPTHQGTIEISKNAQVKPSTGIVLAHNERRDEKGRFSTSLFGCRVWFPAYEGESLQLEGEEDLMILDEAEIQAYQDIVTE